MPFEHGLRGGLSSRLHAVATGAVATGEGGRSTMLWRSDGRRAAIFVAAFAVFALVAAACGDDDGAEETGGGGAVEVTVQEFAVIPATSSAPVTSRSMSPTRDQTTYTSSSSS